MQGKEAAHRIDARRRSLAAALGLLLVAVAVAPAASAAGRVGGHGAEIVSHPDDGLRRVHPGLFGVNHRYRLF